MGVNYAHLRKLTAREIISALIRDGFVWDHGTGSHQSSSCADLFQEAIRSRLLDARRSPSIVKIMARTATKAEINNPRVFEEAREAIIKLEAMSRILTRAELETLEILFDKHVTALIASSLQEAEQGKYEPIIKIVQP